jgi:hypothetical protein
VFACLLVYLFFFCFFVLFLFFVLFACWRVCAHVGDTWPARNHAAAVRHATPQQRHHARDAGQPNRTHQLLPPHQLLRDGQEAAAAAAAHHEGRAAPLLVKLKLIFGFQP